MQLVPYRPDLTEESKVSTEVRLDAQMHQEQELNLAREAATTSARKEVAATVLLEEHLIRQKQENSRTVGHQPGRLSKQQEWRLSKQQEWRLRRQE